VIKGTLNASSRLTFYVKHGDYVARLLSYLGGLLLITSLVLYIKKRFSTLLSR